MLNTDLFLARVKRVDSLTCCRLPQCRGGTRSLQTCCGAAACGRPGAGRGACPSRLCRTRAERHGPSCGHGQRQLTSVLQFYSNSHNHRDFHKRQMNLLTNAVVVIISCRNVSHLTGDRRVVSGKWRYRSRLERRRRLNM